MPPETILASRSIIAQVVTHSLCPAVREKSSRSHLPVDSVNTRRPWSAEPDTSMLWRGETARQSTGRGWAGPHSTVERGPVCHEKLSREVEGNADDDGNEGEEEEAEDDLDDEKDDDDDDDDDTEEGPDVRKGRAERSEAAATPTELREGVIPADNRPLTPPLEEEAGPPTDWVVLLLAATLPIVGRVILEDTGPPRVGRMCETKILHFYQCNSPIY